MVSHGLQIVSIMIHVVAAVGLSRAAMSASINGDDPITLGEEEQHLRVPIVCAEGPPMAEHDGLPFAPVFIIDLNVGSVFFPNCYVWHDMFLSVLVVKQLLTQTTCDEQRFASDPRRIV